MCSINGSTPDGTIARITGAIAAKNGDKANADKANAYADQLDGKTAAGGSASVARAAKRPSTVLTGKSGGKTVLGA
jgi:hypothetical protein